MSIEHALRSYVETMLWSSTGENDEPLDRDFCYSDVIKKCLTQSKKDLADFYAMAQERGVDLSKYTDQSIGHDFWLTRNGHGAGFWDGDYEKSDGEILTDISKTFGEIHVYSYRKKIRFDI